LQARGGRNFVPFWVVKVQKKLFKVWTNLVVHNCPDSINKKNKGIWDSGPRF